MKTMTCRQLAGACDMEFQAETFEEISEMCKNHAMEMGGKGDQPHIQKMAETRETMNKPEVTKEWFEKVQKEFEELPEDK